MEPERKIEKLLRAYAKKRRADAGAPLEMHPATRRLLQGEMARRRPDPAERNIFVRLYAALRPRLVLVACVVGLLLVAAGLLLPGLGKAKSKSQAIGAMNSLKQIGLAAQIYAEHHSDRLPVSLADMKNELGTDKLLIDPQSGKPFEYIGGGRSLSNLQPDTLLAYSPLDKKGRAVLFANGSVRQVNSRQFLELSNKNALLLAGADVKPRGQFSIAGETRPAQLTGGTPPETTPALERQRTLAQETEQSKTTVTVTKSITGRETQLATQTGTTASQVQGRLEQLSAAAASAGAGGFGGRGSLSQGGITTGVSAGLPHSDARRAPPALASSSTVTAGGIELSDRAGTGETWGLNEQRGDLKKAQSKQPDKLALAETPVASTLTAGASAPKAALPPTGEASDQTPSALPASQRFVQIETVPGSTQGSRVYFKLNNTAPLLNEFRVAQNGAAIQIVDEDGSVYNGRVELANAAAAPGQATEGQKAAVLVADSLSVAKNSRAMEALQSVVQNYNFIVTGTNRSLKQSIVFAGNLVTLTNQAPVNPVTNGLAYGASQSQQLPENVPQLPLANARISGTAMIDNSRKVEINAVPVTR